MSANNDFSGGLTAISIPGPTQSADDVNLTTPNWLQGWQGGNRPQSVINVEGGNILFSGIGAQADTVNVTADEVNTASGAAIEARLAFNPLLGSAQQMPGVDFMLRDPGAFQPGVTWGSASNGLVVDIGDAKDSARAPMGWGVYNDGLLQVDPELGRGKAMYLAGQPQAAGGYGFFYARAQDSQAVLVFYNGYASPAPEVQSALATATSEPAKARETLFDEAVRTENVGTDPAPVA